MQYFLLSLCPKGRSAQGVCGPPTLCLDIHITLTRTGQTLLLITGHKADTHTHTHTLTARNINHTIGPAIHTQGQAELCIQLKDTK